MATSKVTPAYPQSILSWTDRVDEQDIVWATDPNSLAAEVESIETTLGAMPQLEANPVVGPQINFTSVNQRLDYLTAQAQVPLIQLGSQGQNIASRQGASTNYGVYNSYGSVAYDNFGMWNGSDVTVPVTGWFYIDAVQYWPWSQAGYVAMHLAINGNLVESDLWSWDMPENVNNGAWQAYGTVGRAGCTKVRYNGILNQGDRVRVVSENGTTTTPVAVSNMRLSVSMGPVTTPDPKILPVQVTVATATKPSGPPPPKVVSRYPAPNNLTLSNIGNGNILASWDRITSPTPVPSSYTIAVYYTSGGLASYTTVDAPDTTGREAVTVANLQLHHSYQVHVWANGGLIAPPHASRNISI